MIGEAYPISEPTYFYNEDVLLFTFVSEGYHDIRKLVVFSPIESNGIKIFNWGFGDFHVNADTPGISLDDKSQTNNGDTKRVFYTVVSTLSIFFLYHPAATVRIKGSDERRTRLYKSLVARHWKDINQLYSVRMSSDNMTIDFNTTKDCDYILISQQPHRIFN
jgi:hypothetical protein